jgi:hypothetical protein
MTRRLREPVAVDADAERSHAGFPAPAAFRWRGARYRVTGVLGHWREDAGYWAGGGIQVPQRDLWRVEAAGGGRRAGIYELVCESGNWLLDRIWD